MKKHYFFKFILLLIPISAFVLLSFSTGRDSAFSGSPGDGGSNCTSCHTGTTASNSNVTITSNIPDTGYDFNTTYNVTITNAAGSTRNGFQVTAERDDNNGKVGTFVSGGSDTQAVNSGQRITHTSNGNNQSSWTFQWTSPSTDVGRVTFYGASVSGNGSGSSGDQVFLGQSNSSPSLSVDNLTKIDFDTYPNPATDFVTLQLASNTDNAVVAFYDSVGKIALQTNITNTQNKIDVNNLSSGIYLIKIISGNSIGTQKFIKQ